MIRKITLQLTFRTSNKIHDTIKTRTNNTNTHMRSATYQLQCNTYHFSYIGQTGSCLEKKDIKNMRYITSSNTHSAYALHVLHNKHEYGPMNVIMSVIHPAPKCRRTNLSETSIFSFSNNITPASMKNPREINFPF
jgi:hypothetical protein